ncbi:hypothetical protein RF11_14616 [Thelohanellus kitauei]|uniref:Uncharacterized protein n=1 Tax=Thelohanellus kitauei TaxID=669202 RepID=A0A0C2NBM6_THEKT|nr:hypothetical protein RF11_14616 [Thelohanellus kitauei]
MDIAKLLITPEDTFYEKRDHKSSYYPYRDPILIQLRVLFKIDSIFKKISLSTQCSEDARSILIENELEVPPSIMISKDGGYSWADVCLISQTSTDFTDMFGLNDGEVLLGISKQIFTDYGNSWKNLTLNISSYSITSLCTGTASAKYKFIAIIYSDKYGFEIVIVDFSALFRIKKLILEKKCQPSDYRIYTPGRDLLNSCFHGRDGIFYEKISNSLCESVISDLPAIKSNSCICTPEDYIW